MDNSIVMYLENFGEITFDIKSVMKRKKISLNQVVKRTGLHHQVVKRYYNGDVERFDRVVLAKLCYVLECSLSDIMYYKEVKKSEEH